MSDLSAKLFDAVKTAEVPGFPAKVDVVITVSQGGKVRKLLLSIIWLASQYHHTISACMPVERYLVTKEGHKKVGGRSSPGCYRDPCRNVRLLSPCMFRRFSIWN